jgi:hypothetical protein
MFSLFRPPASNLKRKNLWGKAAGNRLGGRKIQTSKIKIQYSGKVRET